MKTGIYSAAGGGCVVQIRAARLLAALLIASSVLPEILFPAR